MSTGDSSKVAGGAPGETAGPHPQPGASRSIARMAEPHALTTRQLEERRLIHRHESARAQADAFREIRTRLLALGGEQNFVTLVTSVSPGSGGSFVARNLAAAFAFDEAKTALLIDCNPRLVEPFNGLVAIEARRERLIQHVAVCLAALHHVKCCEHVDVPRPDFELLIAGHSRCSGSQDIFYLVRG